LHHSHGEKIYAREVLFLHGNSLLGYILTRNSCDFCRSPIILGAVKILGSYGGLSGGMTVRIKCFPKRLFGSPVKYKGKIRQDRDEICYDDGT
jgi:hypothetical protein